MKSNNLEEALRFLKQKGILKSNVAFELGFTASHLSKILNGQRSLTKKNINTFNEIYGKYVILELPDDEEEIKNILEDPETPYFPENKKMTAERSLLKVLMDDYVALKADITEGDAEAILSELLRKASEVAKAHF